MLHPCVAVCFVRFLPGFSPYPVIVQTRNCVALIQSRGSPHSSFNASVLL